jgi:hypothetical protein
MGRRELTERKWCCCGLTCWRHAPGREITIIDALFWLARTGAPRIHHAAPRTLEAAFEVMRRTGERRWRPGCTACAGSSCSAQAL